jgi:uncharacterized membrane protein YobD (UPF0266 family)
VVIETLVTKKAAAHFNEQIENNSTGISHLKTLLIILNVYANAIKWEKSVFARTMLFHKTTWCSFKTFLQTLATY